MDNYTLDKFYAEKMELVSWYWSGKHGWVLLGINLMTLLGIDGDAHIPYGYRLYEKSKDGATKNDGFDAMLVSAKERGFKPRRVVFDSWFSSLDNLKQIRSYKWVCLTRLNRNRLR